MTDSITFKDFYIGTPDGETEARNEKFEELFYDSNNKYSELVENRHKFIILGSKGSGKTYLANYICKKAKKGQKCKIINSQDFWIDRLANTSVEQENNAYVYALCKWFFLDKVSKVLLDHTNIIDKICPWNPKRKLAKFVKQYDNDETFKAIKSIESGCKTSEKGYMKSGTSNIKLNAYSLEDSNSFSTKNLKSKTRSIESERKPFYELINSYERLIFKAVSSKNDIIIIFDDLDELDKKLTKESAGNDIITNLLKIAKNYNTEFYDGNLKVRLILLVRTDILDKLQSYDTNLSKIKTSCAVELYWLTNNENEPHEQPLMSMVLHKIKASCPQLATYTNKDLYTRLFPEKIDNKRPIDYILDNSFGRPRDIVTFLNYVIDMFPDNTYFTALSVKAIRKFYSSDFYNELLNEVYFHEAPEYTLDCFKLISSLKKTSFDYADISDHYKENHLLYPAINDINLALEYLYKIGAIGNVWKVKKGQKEKLYTSWAYKKDAMNEVDLTKRFTIHYALRKKFAL